MKSGHGKTSIIVEPKHISDSTLATLTEGASHASSSVQASSSTAMSMKESSSEVRMSSAVRKLSASMMASSSSQQVTSKKLDNRVFEVGGQEMREMHQ